MRDEIAIVNKDRSSGFVELVVDDVVGSSRRRTRGDLPRVDRVDLARMERRSQTLGLRGIAAGYATVPGWFLRAQKESETAQRRRYCLGGDSALAAVVRAAQCAALLVLRTSWITEP